MIGGLDGAKILAPSTGLIMQLVGSKEDLFMLPTPHKILLLLNSVQSMISMERILRPGENGWIGLLEMREVIIPSSSTITTGSQELINSLKEPALLLTVALYLHKNFSHHRRRRWLVHISSVGVLQFVFTCTGTSPHPVSKQGSATGTKFFTLCR